MSSKHIQMTAEARERVGKGNARATRRTGLVPAVIYGDKKSPVSIAIDFPQVIRTLNAGKMFTSVCEMKVGNDQHLVLARDVQYHPVSDDPLHIDFMRVTDKTEISVEVPVTFLNEEECKGIEEGGILSVSRYTVEVTCRAAAIPDYLEVDITDKEIGDTIRMSELNLPKGVVPTVTDRDVMIANISAPKRAEELEELEEEGAPEDAAEPEVLTEKKDDEGEEGDSQD